MEHLLRLVSLFCLVVGLGVNAGVEICPLLNWNFYNCDRRGLSKVLMYNGTLKITRLSLKDNSLTRLTKDSFTSWKDLEELSLDRCQLRSIDNETFRPLTNLNILTLGGNFLTFNEGIFANVFTGISNLNRLIMTGNPLGTIPINAFSGLTKLTDLRIASTIQGLKLKHKSFNGLKNLRTLDLSNNSLVTLPASMGESFNWRLINRVDISKNNLHCDCKLFWLNEMDLNKGIILGKCASPSNMQGKDFSTWKPEKYECLEPSEHVSVDMSSSNDEANAIRCHQFTDENQDIDDMKNQLSEEMVSKKKIGNGWYCFGDTANKELLLEVSQALKTK